MQAVIVGDTPEPQLQRLKQAFEAIDVELVVVENLGALIAGLSDKETLPRAVLLHETVEGAGEFVTRFRNTPQYFGIPLYSVSERIEEKSYVQAFSVGMDDVLFMDDAQGVERRIALLKNHDPNAPPRDAGHAVVAHADEVRRHVLGRIFWRAGFKPTLVSNTDELISLLEQGMSPKIVAIDQNLPPATGLACMQVMRAKFGSIPCILDGPCRSVLELESNSRGLSMLAVTHEAAPPDQLLFYANELLAAGSSDQRVSRRIVWTSLCSFRPAGTMQPNYGLTYNISHRGLFVRTTALPQEGSEVWLEFQYPNGKMLAHLRAIVKWVRGLSSRGAGPVGFGCEFIEPACPPIDLDLYSKAYAALAAEPTPIVFEAQNG